MQSTTQNTGLQPPKRRIFDSSYGVIRFSSLAWLMIIISFLGFAVEDIWLLITRGYANNRNMYLPFLFGYGLAVFAVFLFFGTPQDRGGLIGVDRFFSGWKKTAVYILQTAVFVSIAEIILGTSVEKLCGFHYWDYTNLPLHITRYTSVFTSLGFSCMISAFMRFCLHPALHMLGKLDSRRFRILGYILLAALLIDYFLSFGYMIRYQEYHFVWAVYI